MATLEKDRIVGPFIKWAGGKAGLIRKIDNALPNNLLVQEYYEPFVGGGAVFFHVIQKFTRLKKVVISDINTDLINCYISLRDNPIKLGHELIQLESKYNSTYDLFKPDSPKSDEMRKEMYIDIRNKFNANFSIPVSIELKSAWFIFLNKSCFNGLYRVNSKGKFNVPFGKRKKINLIEPKKFIEVSRLLQNVEIINTDFKSFFNYYNPVDALIYLDPPYHPVSETSDFTAYDKAGFGIEDHRDLAHAARLESNGNFIVASNSDTEFTRKIYEEAGFHITPVQAKRSINSKGDKRGNVGEIIATNYIPR